MSPGRHAIWAAAFAGMLLLPMAAQLLPPLPVLPASARTEGPLAGPQSARQPTPAGPAAPSAPLFLIASLLVGLTSVAVQMLVPIAAHMAPEASRGRIVGRREDEWT